MTRSFGIALAIASSAVLGTVLSGQEPTADEIIRVIQSSGSISSTLKYVTLDGCPQEVTRSRDLIAAAGDAQLPPSAIAELALAWRRGYADCEYEPLDAWFATNLRRLSVSNDLSDFNRFVRYTASVLKPDLREIIWGAVETRTFEPDFALLLATTASNGGTPGERVARSLDAFRTRETPVGWVEAQSAALVRDEPELFLDALAAATPNLSDARLTSALSGIEQMLRRGHLDAEVGALVRLRSSVRDRSGVPLELRELREVGTRG